MFFLWWIVDLGVLWVNWFFWDFFLFGCATEQRFQVKKPYLYQITKGANSGFLFGSIHTGVHTDDLPEKFWTFVDQSQIVVTEVDVSDKEALDKFSKKVAQQGVKKNLAPETATYFSESEVAFIN